MEPQTEKLPVAPPPAAPPPGAPAGAARYVPSDWPFFIGFGILGGTYVLLIVAMLLADTTFSSTSALLKALASEDIQYSIVLSLFSCSLTALLSVIIAVPLGYLLSRHLQPAEDRRAASGTFGAKGRRLLSLFNTLLDTVLDIPVVLPPLVIGISLLILFRYAPFRYVDRWVTYAIPGVILAQFMVACAFAVRTMRVTFDQTDARRELVALTLGCTRWQAFWHVVLPEIRQGVLAAATLSWARALGEFGPILVFAGATRGHTEVLSTSVFLELSIGNLDGSVAVSLIMVAAAVGVLMVTRLLGLQTNNRKTIWL